MPIKDAQMLVVPGKLIKLKLEKRGSAMGKVGALKMGQGDGPSASLFNIATVWIFMCAEKVRTRCTLVRITRWRKSGEKARWKPNTVCED